MADQTNTFVWIAIFVIIGAIVNSTGIVIIFKYRKWAEKA